MANIHDVVKRLRVSAAAVSAAVNDHAYVSSSPTSRVDQATRGSTTLQVRRVQPGAAADMDAAMGR